MEPGYRILEHPSDVGIEAVGNSMQEVFEYAALGLMSLVVDRSEVKPVEQRSVHLTAYDREGLLVKWLSEILFLYDGEDFLAADVAIKQINENELTAVLSGESVDAARHTLKLDIKAITYHQLNVSEHQNGWLLHVFVDI